MSAWLLSLRDRPIAESERRAVLAIVAALLIACAVLLTITQPASHQLAPVGHAPARRAQARPDPAAPRRDPSGTTAPSQALEQVSREFLAGYLAYLYGQGGAGQVRDATRQLLGSLQAHPPRASVDMRARRPRVLELQATPSVHGGLEMTATVGDGGVSDYPVVLLLARQGSRLVVSGLGER